MAGIENVNSEMDGVDNVLHAPIPSGSSSFVPTVLVNGSTIAEMDQEKYTIIKNLCENILHDYPAKHNIMDEIQLCLKDEDYWSNRTNCQVFVQTLTSMGLYNNIKDVGKILSEMLINKVLSVTDITRGIEVVFKDSTHNSMVQPKFFYYIVNLLAPMISYFPIEVNHFLDCNISTCILNPISKSLKEIKATGILSSFMEKLGVFISSSIDGIWTNKMDSRQLANRMNEWIDNFGDLITTSLVNYWTKKLDSDQLFKTMYAWMDANVNKTVIKYPHFLNLTTIATALVCIKHQSSFANILIEDRSKLFPYYFDFGSLDISEIEIIKNIYYYMSTKVASGSGMNKEMNMKIRKLCEDSLRNFPETYCIKATVEFFHNDECNRSSYTKRQEFIKTLALMGLNNNTKHVGNILSELLVTKSISVADITRGINQAQMDSTYGMKDCSKLFYYFVPLISPFLILHYTHVGDKPVFDNNIPVCALKTEYFISRPYVINDNVRKLRCFLEGFEEIIGLTIYDIRKHQIDIGKLIDILYEWIDLNFDKFICRFHHFLNIITITMVLVCMKQHCSFDDILAEDRSKLLPYHFDFDSLDKSEMELLRNMFGYLSGVLIKYLNRIMDYDSSEDLERSPKAQDAFHATTTVAEMDQKTNNKIRKLCNDSLQNFPETYCINATVKFFHNDECNWPRYTKRQEFIKTLALMGLNNNIKHVGNILSELLVNKSISVADITRGINQAKMDSPFEKTDNLKFFYYFVSLLSPFLILEYAHVGVDPVSVYDVSLSAVASELTSAKTKKIREEIEDLVLFIEKLGSYISLTIYGIWANQFNSKQLVDNMYNWMDTNANETITMFSNFPNIITISAILVCMKYQSSFANILIEDHSKLLPYHFDFASMDEWEIELIKYMYCCLCTKVVTDLKLMVYSNY